MWHVYILKLRNGKLYTGMTNNLLRRMKEHQTGYQSKTTTDGGFSGLLYSEEFLERTEASKRERQIKGWTRAKKEALISGNQEELKKLSKRRN